MGKHKLLSETEVLTLVVNNPKLNKYYDDFVDRALYKVIQAHKRYLKGLNYHLEPCGVFVNYVAYETYWRDDIDTFKTIIGNLFEMSKLGYISPPLLKTCVKLAEKSSNLLYHYFPKLIEAISNDFSCLCDDIEYQLIRIERKDIDEIPTEYLSDFLATDCFGKGKIIIH